MTDVAVVGAGMVGVSAAIHLLRRGRSVVLIERNERTIEASYGNGGLIQSEGILPLAFPRGIGELARIALNRDPGVRYQPYGLLQMAGALARYWWHSEGGRYRKIVEESAPLLAGAFAEHQELADAAGTTHLIRHAGWLRMFRSQARLQSALNQADWLQSEYGVPHHKLDGEGIRRLEPDLQPVFAGGIHWHATPTVSDPGALVDACIHHFQSLGGELRRAEVRSIESEGAGWVCRTRDGGKIPAREVVVAAGASVLQLARGFGYRLPLFLKRGYHLHYHRAPGGDLTRPALDTEAGFLLTPMARGIRLTTGVEFARSGAAPDPYQIDAAEPVARQVLALGERVEPSPWMGMRVCTPDMKPLIGAAPGRPGLWFAAALAHRGFTLGPIVGRLLAEAMTEGHASIDLAPFAVERF